MKLLRKLTSKRTWTKVLSGMLTAVMLAGSVPAVGAAEPIRLGENTIDKSVTESGAFYFATTKADIQENEPAPYHMRVVRGGKELPKAKLKLEMFDVSSKYGRDYTAEILDQDTEIINADKNTSIMEELSGDDVEQTMVDDNGNDLSLTEEDAKKELDKNSKMLNEAVDSAWNQYAHAKAKEDGIDIDALYGDKKEEDKSSKSDKAAGQSNMSKEFEKQTGLMDDRTPIKSETDNSELGDVLQAGYGLDMINDMADALEVPSIILDFAEGETEKTIVIKTIDNNDADGDRSAFFKLVSETNNIVIVDACGLCNLTVKDNEAWEKPTVSFAKATFKPEGGYAKVTVKREGLTSMISSVQMTSKDGTAKNGRDFSKVETNVAFPYGVTERMIKIPVSSKYLKDGGEFTLTLSDATDCKMGKTTAKVVIPKGAASYDPKTAEAVGADGNGSSGTVVKTAGDIEYADPINLSVTDEAKSTNGSSKMEDGRYLLHTTSNAFFGGTEYSYADWKTENHYGVSGFAVEWDKESEQPCYTETDLGIYEADIDDSTVNFNKLYNTTTERWGKETKEIFATKPFTGYIRVKDYKKKGMWGKSPKLYINKITPILRAFEFELANADTSALKFMDRNGNLVDYTQIGELSLAGNTQIVNGNVKWTKKDMDELTVAVTDRKYSWIKYLEFVKYDDNGNIIETKRATDIQRQGSATASVKLTESLLDSLGGGKFISFSQNRNQNGDKIGLKGKIAIRAVLAPYPAKIEIKEDDVRAKVNIIKPDNYPKNRQWLKGDFIKVQTVVNDEYKKKYLPVGVHYDSKLTSDSKTEHNDWENDSGESFAVRHLLFEEIRMTPFLEEYDNRLVVKIADKNLRYYDRSKGFFKTARQITSDETGYKYYLIANTEEIEPNKYYELDVKPAASANVACWKQDVATTKYYENTHYFQTSIKKAENLVELLAPKKGDVSLVLSGNAFYSGATLDKVVEGEAWMPAEGVIATVDSMHSDMADSNGKFTVKSISGTVGDNGTSVNLPLYGCKGEAFTYKLQVGGNVQYYRSKAKGSEDNGVLTVNTGKIKVPVTDVSRPYVAAAVGYKPGGVSDRILPITTQGISSMKVTINNCGAEYEDGKKENTEKVEIIAYHPHNAEPIMIASLSKKGVKDEDGKYKEQPYTPEVDKNTEIWNFRFTATNEMGIESSDKIYVRLTTDRKMTVVYDEDGNPVEDSALAYTTYPPVNTGHEFAQPPAEMPEKTDVDMIDDADFMSDFVKFPILGSFNAVFRSKNVIFSFQPLAGGGQRICVGYTPEKILGKTWGGQGTDTDGNYSAFMHGLSDIGTAAKDMADMAKILKQNKAAANEAGESQLLPLKSARIGITFGLYIDFGRTCDKTGNTLEIMGAGGFVGGLAQYRLVTYAVVFGIVPVYFGFDVQLDAMLTLGFTKRDDAPTTVNYNGSKWGFDLSLTARTAFNAYGGVGVCGVFGVRGGINVNGYAAYWPFIEKYHPKEDELLKRNGYSDGLRSAGLHIDVNLKLWVDLGIANPSASLKLAGADFGYYKDIERIEHLNTHSQPTGAPVGASNDGAVEPASSFSYKKSGDPSVWTGSSKNPRKSTYHQAEDFELKTGGYDRADPQLLDIGDNKILLVYVDEDSKNQNDDRMVLRYQIYDKSTNKWLGTPGVIQAKDGGKDINGALEPKLTDAGDKVMITWTALVLPDSTHADSDYFKKYFKQRNVYAAVIEKSELRSASYDAPAQFEGSLVSIKENNCYDSDPAGLYYKDGDKEYLAVTYLSSDLDLDGDDSLTEEEMAVKMAMNSSNNSYVRTAQYNANTKKWETVFDVMKLNSTYDAKTNTWVPIPDSNSTLTGNNPTVIDLDNTVWKDWIIYSFAVDEDNDLSTDEDRELFVKLENLKTGNATVNQITNDGSYTDADGNSHLGIAKSRPQLITSGDSVYLFWQRGKDDVAWLDLGDILDSDAVDSKTGLITDDDRLSCKYVFYPTIGVKIEPTYTSFKPFVDELGNLYVVWLQGIEEDGVLKQELYAQALRTDKNPEGSTQCWSDPVRLTKTKVKADQYTFVYNDEPAIASLGSEDLLVVCNRFASNDKEGDTTAYDLTMRGIRFDTIASVKTVDVKAKNELPAPGEEIDLDVTIKNDGLKTANGFITVLMVIDNDKYEKVKDTTSIWTFLDNCDIVDIEMFYKKLAAGESTEIKLNRETCSPGYNIKMPEKLSESGYKVIMMTAEMKDGNPTDLYYNKPMEVFDEVIQVDPVYSINASADSYRHLSGSLSSNDFVFNAVVSSDGNIAMRDTDRLVVGPGNHDTINIKADDEFYLDVPISQLKDVEDSNGLSKSIKTDIKISPERFKYGFTDLYVQIIDKDGNMVTAPQSFNIEADAPYSVTVNDKKTNKAIGDEVGLAIGESVELEGSYEPSAHFKEGTVVYSVEDPNVATVDENGVVKAVGEGTTKLYASVDIYDAVREYEITVSDEAGYILGDTDGNGTVDIDDVTAIQLYLAGRRAESEINLDAADVDGNGDVTVDDVTTLQMWIAKRETGYDIGEKKYVKAS